MLINRWCLKVPKECSETIYPEAIQAGVHKTVAVLLTLKKISNKSNAFEG